MQSARAESSRSPSCWVPAQAPKALKQMTINICFLNNHELRKIRGIIEPLVLAGGKSTPN
jgi:hypothetical protein